MTGLAEAVVRPHAAAAAMGGRLSIAVTTTMHGASWVAVAGSVVQLGIIAHRVRQLNLIGIDWLGLGGGEAMGVRWEEGDWSRPQGRGGGGGGQGQQ